MFYPFRTQVYYIFNSKLYIYTPIIDLLRGDALFMTKDLIFHP
jgi:hypothetical protein